MILAKKKFIIFFENHKSFDEIFEALVKAGESTGRLVLFKKLNDML